MWGLLGLRRGIMWLRGGNSLLRRWRWLEGVDSGLGWLMDGSVCPVLTGGMCNERMYGVEEATFGFFVANDCGKG